MHRCIFAAVVFSIFIKVHAQADYLEEPDLFIHNDYFVFEPENVKAAPATVCQFRDNLILKSVEKNQDLTGELLDDCTIYHCDATATIIKRNGACKEIGIDGRPKCYLPGENWKVGCNEKTCVENGQWNFVINVTRAHKPGDVWSETTQNGCYINKCNINEQIEKSPGCYYKKEQRCYEVGSTKTVVCSKIQCQQDSLTHASFVGLRIRCNSLRRCVSVGKEWLNSTTCKAQRCEQTVDEYGTQLHTVISIKEVKNHAVQLKQCLAKLNKNN